MAIALVAALSILGAASALNVYEPSGKPFPASGDLKLRWDPTSTEGETFSVYLMNGPDENGQRIGEPIAVGVKVADGETVVHAGRNACGDCFLQFAVDGLPAGKWGYAARFTGNEIVEEPEHIETTTVTETTTVMETIEEITEVSTMMDHVETETIMSSESLLPEHTATTMVVHEPAMTETPTSTLTHTPVHTPAPMPTSTHTDSAGPAGPNRPVRGPEPAPAPAGGSDSDDSDDTDDTDDTDGPAPERRDGNFFNVDASSASATSSGLALVGIFTTAIASIVL